MEDAKINAVQKLVFLLWTQSSFCWHLASHDGTSSTNSQLQWEER